MRKEIEELFEIQKALLRLKADSEQLVKTYQEKHKAFLGFEDTGRLNTVEVAYILEKMLEEKHGGN